MDNKHYAWPRADDRSLARFVQPQALPKALRWPTDLNRRDVLTSSGIQGVAERLYNQLWAQALQYELAPLNPSSAATQLIRKAAVVVEEKQATCLDLAVWFAAMCLDNELLPILILLEGHALAGFSLRRTARSTVAGLKPLAWEAGRLDRLETLRELVDAEFTLVECTGAAHSRSLSSALPEGQGRDPDGTLTFARACDAGRQQILDFASAATETAPPNRRRYLAALDIRDLQLKYGFEPVAEPDPDRPSAGESVFNQHGQTVHGGQTHIAGDVHGPVLSGQFGGPVQIGNIQVGSVQGPAAIGAGAQVTVHSKTPDSLEQVIRLLLEKVEALPAGPAKEDAQTAVQELKSEAGKGEKADESRVRRWFTFLAETAPDAWEVAVTTFQNPIAGVGKVFQLVAARAREERPKKDPQ